MSSVQCPMTNDQIWLSVWECQVGQDAILSCGSGQGDRGMLLQAPSRGVPCRAILGVGAPGWTRWHLVLRMVRNAGGEWVLYMAVLAGRRGVWVRVW
jgi:hypothetical protein